MLHLFTWTTPNGIKPVILLEELGVDYAMHPIDISSGVQKGEAFLSINPNGRIPALVDDDVAGDAAMGDAQGMRVFESGAILVTLAERHGRFLPADGADRAEVLGWTFWQVGGLGPMAGQAHWFGSNDPDGVGERRYVEETGRLLDVLERRLAGRDWLAAGYSIADMMCWDWARAGRRIAPGDRPNLDRWIDRIGERSAVRRARERLDAAANA